MCFQLQLDKNKVYKLGFYSYVMYSDLEDFIEFEKKIHNLFNYGNYRFLETLKSDCLNNQEAYKYYLLCDLLGFSQKNCEDESLYKKGREFADFFRKKQRALEGRHNFILDVGNLLNKGIEDGLKYKELIENHFPNISLKNCTRDYHYRIKAINLYQSLVHKNKK